MTELWGNIDSKWNLNEKNLIDTKKDIENSGVESIDDKKYKKFIEKSFKVIKHLEEIGLPEKNEQIRIITLRTFNSVHFLDYISKNEDIKELLLCIYSINGEASRLLNEIILENDIKSTVLMSNLRNKAHREKEQITRDMFVENKNIDLFFASSHAKIMAFRTEKDNFYVVEGSGNMSYNSRIEQYVIDNDKDLFYFTKKWMNEIKVFLKGKKEFIQT